MTSISTCARLLFWLTLAAALYLALSPHPPQVIETNDKIKHMLAFGTLAALAAEGFRDTPLLRIGERLSFVGALIEVVQSIPALGRDCDIMDWIADTAVIVGVLVVVWTVRRNTAGS